MISDARLREIFEAELHSTGSPEAALGAVKVAVLAGMATSREAGRRGPRRQHSGDPLTHAQVVEVEMVVADVFDLAITRVRTGGSRPCVHARFVSCAVLKRLDMSLPQIARALSLTNNNHTIALHAVRRVEALPDLRKQVERVLEVLRRRGWDVPPIRTTEAA